MADAEKIKAAKRKYAEKVKGKYKTLSITQTAEKTEQDRATLAEHDATVLTVWRRAMELLKNGELFKEN